jgi:hypothetical protein
MWERVRDRAYGAVMRRLHPATKAAFVVIAVFGLFTLWLIWWISQPSDSGRARPGAVSSQAWSPAAGSLVL